MDSPDANGRLWTTYNDNQWNLLTRKNRKIAKREMYFKSSTIDFIVQGKPQTVSETLMENSDKWSLFTDGTIGSVGKYYTMVIERDLPSLHQVTTLGDLDLSGATYDGNAVPEESWSSLGRREEGR
ncbi:hypothetical protein L210DRAFT_3502495 [Boletus edulis BED1]|uniref:Uncharacterized protein n=1 Tax=Boletus edulis BED1 TaxID=1328754 RepID=A0AAD4GH77_BOLED|nr:hypothetical protein L210DRAFT_3502495 [Boletus edulis BED1]